MCSSGGFCGLLRSSTCGDADVDPVRPLENLTKRRPKCSPKSDIRSRRVIRPVDDIPTGVFLRSVSPGLFRVAIP